MELILTIVSSGLAILLLILQRSQKTKVDKAREVVNRSSAQLAKLKFLNQTRQNEKLEQELDQQERELVSVLAALGVQRKTDPKSGN